MDTVKTGRFIAGLRREKKLTQEQLGEALGVSNKTISRWENGNYMPPVEMLQELGAFFQVSINELLSGERLDEHSYRQRAEQNLKESLSQSPFSLQERIDFYKKKWRRDHIFAIAAGLILVAGAMAAGLIFDNFLRFAALPAGLAWGILLYNRMMAYGEKHAFDGSGSRPKI